MPIPSWPASSTRWGCELSVVILWDEVSSRVLLKVDSSASLLLLKDIFRKRVHSSERVQSLKSHSDVIFPPSIEDILLTLIAGDKEPSKRIRKLQTPAGMRLEFRRYAEGWLETAELIEGLEKPGHQYLIYDGSNDVDLVVSYME